MSFTSIPPLSFPSSHLHPSSALSSESPALTLSSRSGRRSSNIHNSRVPHPGILIQGIPAAISTEEPVEGDEEDEEEGHDEEYCGCLFHSFFVLIFWLFCGMRAIVEARKLRVGFQ